MPQPKIKNNAIDTESLTNVDAATLGGILPAEVAPLASPTFTGIPTTPLAAFGTNTAQLASTAFTQQEIDGEAGTWIPELSDSSASVTSAGQTYEFQDGYFLKVGKLVHLTFYMKMSSLGTLNASSSSFIHGLPYVPDVPNGANREIYSCVISFFQNLNLPVPGTAICGIVPNTPIIQLGQFGSANFTSIGIDELTATTALKGTITYITI